jgi:hypothetical protein
MGAVIEKLVAAITEAKEAAAKMEKQKGAKVGVSLRRRSLWHELILSTISQNHTGSSTWVPAPAEACTAGSPRDTQ